MEFCEQWAKIQLFFLLENREVLSLHDSMGVLSDGFRPFSIPTCVQDLPMFLPNFTTISSLVRTRECLEQTLRTHKQTNGMFKFDANLKYILCTKPPKLPSRYYKRFDRMNIPLILQWWMDRKVQILFDKCVSIVNLAQAYAISFSCKCGFRLMFCFDSIKKSLCRFNLKILTTFWS